MGLTLGQGFRVTGPMVAPKPGALALARRQSFPEDASPLYSDSGGKTDADLDLEKARKWVYRWAAQNGLGPRRKTDIYKLLTD